MAFLLHQLLTETAERRPEQMAVAGPGGALSYGALERLANQLARQLREDGVCPGDRVGVFAPKSVQAVAALFGIQKAGAAYVPVDPNSRAPRAASILGNCSVRGLVSTAERAAKLPLDSLAAHGLESLVLLGEAKGSTEQTWPASLRAATLADVQAAQPAGQFAVPITESDLAYILYTSGSTGEPKGVMISHRNSLSFVEWCYETFCVTSHDHVSNHAPFHFDLSVFDIFCTVKAGGTIFLVPPAAAAFPAELARWITENEISMWYSVPSALIQLVEHGQMQRHNYQHLRVVLFAGEIFPIKYLRRLVQLLPQPAYYNLYGPTETNVCTYYQVQPSDLDSDRIEPVPIGRACANTEVFAINDRGELAPVGEEGELYIRSASGMKGYWGRPEDTARVVVPNFLDGRSADVLYRTGDIVRQLPTGDYQYLGRRDKMIKSRGYRIELGEIEAALYAHSCVLEAAVVPIPDEQVGARIKAYVVARDGLTPRELQRFCAECLPRYMVPEFWEWRVQLPKTSTGKIDRSFLEKEAASQ